MSGALAYGQMKSADIHPATGITEACTDGLSMLPASHAGVWGAARPSSGEREGSSHLASAASILDQLQHIPIRVGQKRHAHILVVRRGGQRTHAHRQKLLK